MNDEPKSGQKVTWNSHGGEAHGKVVKKVTSPTMIKIAQGCRVQGQPGVHRRNGRRQARCP